MSGGGTYGHERHRAFLAYSAAATLCLLFAYISFIPFYYLPPLSIGLGTIDLPVFRAVPTGLLLVLTITQLPRLVARQSWFPNLVGCLILLYILICLASVFQAEAPVRSLAKVLYYSLTGPFVALLVSHVLNTDKKRRSFVILAFSISCVVAMYGLVQYIIGQDVLFGSFEEYNPYHRGTKRVGSSLGNPVVLGSYLAAFFPMGWHLGRYVDNVWRRGFIAGALACIGACLLLTFSRGAWIAVVVGGGAYGAKQLIGWFRRQSTGRHLRLILVVALLWPAVALVLPSLGLGEIQQQATRSLQARGEKMLDLGDTEAYRIAQYRTTWSILARSPVLGIGFGEFTRQFERIKHPTTPPNSVSDARTTENMYLMIASETGLAGIIVFMVLLGAIVREGWRMADQSHSVQERDMSRALLCGLAALMVAMVAWDALNHPAIRIIFWMMVGSTLKLARWQDADNQFP